MVRSNRVNLLNFVAEGRCFVNDELQELMRGRLSGQLLKLPIDR